MSGGPVLRIFDVTIDVGGGAGLFERIVRGLAREARKAATDRTYMSRVKFRVNWKLHKRFDSWIPAGEGILHLAALLAIQDVIGGDKDAQVCIGEHKVGEYDDRNHIWEWGVHVDTGDQRPAIWQKLGIGYSLVFNASNAEGGGLGKGTWCQRMWWLEVQTRWNHEYWGNVEGRIFDFADTIAQPCPKKLLYSEHTRKHDDVIERRLAIAQITGIPEDVRRLLADMDDPWFDVQHSMNSRGMPGYQRPIPTQRKYHCDFCQRKLKTVQGRLAHMRVCGKLYRTSWFD
jgi:hypothetical protein